MDTIILASPNQFGYFTIYYNYAIYLSKEIKVIYLCFDQRENKFKERDNIKVIYVALSNNKIRNFFRYYQTIIRIFNSTSHPKLILKYYYFSFLLNLFIPRKDLILDIRTGYTSESAIKSWVINLIIRIESLFYKRIITLSESLRMKLSLQIEKTTIIPLGAVPVTTPFKRFEKLVLLYIGTLTSRNIPQTVVGLSQFVKNQGKGLEIKYYIVGGGKPEEVKKLKDTIDQFNLQEIVHYEGPVYGENLRKYFHECNIGISYIPMIRDYDCQPATKTVEYLMAGMPVLATETFENKKIISDVNGILIRDNPQSFAEGLKKIISEREKFNSSKITDSVKEHSYEFIIENKLKPLLFL